MKKGLHKKVVQSKRFAEILHDRERMNVYITSYLTIIIFTTSISLFLLLFCFALDRLEIANCCLVVPSVSLKAQSIIHHFFGNPSSELRIFVFPKLLSSYTYGTQNRRTTSFKESEQRTTGNWKLKNFSETSLQHNSKTLKTSYIRQNGR